MKKLLSVSAWILLVCAVQELALRIVFPLPELRYFNRIEYGKAQLPRPGTSAIRSVKRIHESAPDKVAFTHTLNYYGFRDANWKLTPPPNITRVMFVGDSFVEGVMVADGNTIPQRFENLANRSEIQLQAMNLGVAGVNLESYLQLSTDAVPWFKADWIILVLFANDFAGTPVKMSERRVEYWESTKPRLLELIRMLRNREMLPFRWSFRRIREFQPVPHPNNPFVDPEYERRVERFVSPRFIDMMKRGLFNPFKPNITHWYEQLLRQPIDIRPGLVSIRGFLADRHCNLLIAYLPERRQISNFYKRYETEFSPDNFDLTQQKYQEYQRQLTEQCDELGIPFLDLSKTIAEEESRGNHLYWHYDDHLTAEGNRVVANALFEAWKNLQK